MPCSVTIITIVHNVSRHRWGRCGGGAPPSLAVQRGVDVTPARAEFEVIREDAGTAVVNNKLTAASGATGVDSVCQAHRRHCAKALRQFAD